MKKWIFIIDTDSYAGNFERDMCAYLTGVTGDCQVGDNFAALYHKEVKSPDGESVFHEYLEQRADDRGCCRPASCWPTKGWLSVGDDKAVRKEKWNQKEADEAWQESQAKIYREYKKQTLLVKPGQGIYDKWTQDEKDRELARNDKEIARCLKEKSPKYEPHNSVAIFFEKKPTAEMIALMKKRAAKFAQANRDVGNPWDKNFKLTIHGFRLVEETPKSRSKEI